MHTVDRHRRGGRPGRRLRLRAALTLLLSAALAGGSARAGTVSYVYDELGRLVGVVDHGGEAAIYRYDAGGNVLSVSRQPSTALSIIDVAPRRGPVGTTVTIAGTGFAAAGNEVRFNGVIAAMLSASATRIVTAVPPGASTGPVSVSAGAASATSPSPFTVTAGPPSITGLAPRIGVPGASVTVTGTGFAPRAADQQVTFNALRPGAIGAASDTALEVAVPPGVGSGRLTVETPGGRAVSADDFFIPPPPRTAADVEATGRLAPGGSHTLALATPGKIALVVFDAAAGERVALGVATSAASVSLAIHDPAGAVVTTAVVSPPGRSIELSLRAPGTHTIAVTPVAGATGSVTLSAATPDFAVAELVAPAAAGTQQPFALSWTVRNQGAGAAAGLWADSVYLSTDPICCAGATQIAVANRSEIVPAGGRYTETRSVTMPPLSPGQYYLTVWADSGGLVFESDETNNGLTRPVTVTVPDLVPVEIAAPASASGQQAVSVSWTVENRGTGPVAGVWADRLYLSPTPDCCAGAIALLVQNVASPTPAGGRYVLTQTVTIPPVAPGSYHLVVDVDTNNAVFETDEGNNRLARPLAVTMPDLVPTALTGPASASPRQAVTVSWMVANQGTGPALGLWADTLYLSPVPTCCSGATALVSVNVAPGTPAGGSYGQSQTVTIPPVSGGTYYLVVWADAGGSRAETREDNNLLARPLIVTLPDLAPTALTAPLLASPGQSVSVSWTVRNQGPGTTFGSWTDRIYISPVPSCCAGATSLASAPIAQVASAGASYARTQAVTIPRLPAGSYYLIVKADADGGLAEASETNNERSRKIYILRQ